jgi:hypothetical protein
MSIDDHDNIPFFSPCITVSNWDLKGALSQVPHVVVWHIQARAKTDTPMIFCLAPVLFWIGCQCIVDMDTKGVFFRTVAVAGVPVQRMQAVL